MGIFFNVNNFEMDAFLWNLWLGFMMLNATFICDKVCQWLVTGRRFSSDNPISSTNKTDCHNITEILLKVAFNIINPNHKFHRKASISKLFTRFDCSLIQLSLFIQGTQGNLQMCSLWPVVLYIHVKIICTIREWEKLGCSFLWFVISAIFQLYHGDQF
jgi:hypothetical protein